MILTLVKNYATTSKLKSPLTKTRQILNTSLNLYGLYNNEIKLIVKEITKSNATLKALDNADFNTYEVQLVYAKLISGLNFEKFCYYLAKLTPHIDSWAITDSIEFKNYSRNLDYLDKLVIKLLNSENPWEIRIGFILRMMYFKTGYDINRLISEMIRHTHHEFYYIKMVIAWLGQVLYLNYPDEIVNYLKSDNINPLTKSMTIRKLLDSFRLSLAEKEMIKKLRKT